MRISKRIKAFSPFRKAGRRPSAFPVIGGVRFIVLFALLANVVWRAPAALAQGVYEVGDGTTTTEAAVLAMAKVHYEAPIKNDVKAYRATYYFTSEQVAASFDRGAPIVAGLTQYFAAQNPSDIQLAELAAHPSDMGYGIYYIAYYMDGHDKPLIRPLEIAVVNHQPFVVYDALQSAMTVHDAMVNPLFGGKNAESSSYGSWLKPLWDEREIQRWSTADEAALARMANLSRKVYACKIAMMEYSAAHGMAGAKDFSDDQWLAAYAERDRLNAMSPGEIRDLYLNAIKNEVDKIYSDGKSPDDIKRFKDNVDALRDKLRALNIIAPASSSPDE